MSARLRLILLPVALATATALLWTTLGSLSVAEAQKSGVIARAHSGDRAPSFDKNITILILGSDARSGNPESELMDSIHVLNIDPKTRKAMLVGIPRDTYVSIDGGARGKINSAGVGGPQRMIGTIEKNWGCVFNYYMVIGFEGFRKLTRDIGGITIRVPVDMFERCCSKINLKAGTQKLAGEQALAYARNRHVNRPRGDLDRSQAQGDLMVGALRDARKNVQNDVRVPMRSLAALRRHVKMDIPLHEALQLGLLAMSINPDRVVNTVADGNPASEGGASIVRLTSAGNQMLFRACAGQF